MNDTQLIIIVFIIINCAGIVHIIVAKRNYFPTLKIPIYQGWFGSNKTWRGALMMGGIGLIMGAIFTQSLLGLWLGLAYIIGELPNSYIKRKLSVQPGTLHKGGRAIIQYLIDMIDSVSAVGLMMFIWYNIQRDGLLIILIIGTINHIFIDRISGKIKKLPNMRLIITQSLCYIIYQIRYPRRSQNTISYQGQPTIIISNHIGMMDPFIILGSIPWGVFWDLLPVRIMIKPKKLHHTRWGPLLYLVGGYSSHTYDEQNNNLSITHSLNYLIRGESLMIFPQGGIDDQAPGIGARYIHQHTPGSILMLFRLVSDPTYSTYIGHKVHDYDNNNLTHYYLQDMNSILNYNKSLTHK